MVYLEIPTIVRNNKKFKSLWERGSQVAKGQGLEDL